MGALGCLWGPLYFPQASCTLRAKHTPERPGANLPCSSVAGKQNLATCIRRSWPWVVSQFSPPYEGKAPTFKEPFFKNNKKQKTTKQQKLTSAHVNVSYKAALGFSGPVGSVGPSASCLHRIALWPAQRRGTPGSQPAGKLKSRRDVRISTGPGFLRGVSSVGCSLRVSYYRVSQRSLQRLMALRSGL